MQLRLLAANNSHEAQGNFATFDEARNVGPLVAQLTRAVRGIDCKSLLVNDNSPNLTWLGSLLRSCSAVLHLGSEVVPRPKVVRSEPH
jgi:hypothetical protein